MPVSSPRLASFHMIDIKTSAVQNISDYTCKPSYSVDKLNVIVQPELGKDTKTQATPR